MIEDFEDEFIDSYFFKKVVSKINCGWKNYNIIRNKDYYTKVGYSCSKYNCKNIITDWYLKLKYEIKKLLGYLSSINKSERPNWFTALSKIMNYCSNHGSSLSPRKLEKYCRYSGDAILIFDVYKGDNIITSNVIDFKTSTDFFGIKIITYKRTSYSGKIR